MADEKTSGPGEPISLDYRNPNETPRRLNHAPIWWALGVLAAMALGVLILLPFLGKARPESYRMKCSSNFKNIAAAMITYANAHQGAYPGSMEELVASSGLSPSALICPGSNDTPATTPTELADLSKGGHCSYIYLGKGLNSDASAETVLAYEPLANHHNHEMGVLFGDYRVEYLPAAEGKQLLASIVPGKPTVWPLPATTQPARKPAAQ